MSDIEIIREKAEKYIQWDPVKDTREEVQSLLKDEKWDLLRPLVLDRLSFGTAGLRGKMGSGYSRMNDLVVLQTAQGLCEYIISVFGEDAKRRGIIVGYDHRKLGELSSKSFFEITVKVFNQRGVPVYGFDQYAFTPLVPFSISVYNCCAGIMITASHNPAADNGYKIYWENGCQIISPHDANISRYISENLEPWCDYTQVDSISFTNVTEDAVAKYMAFMTLKLHSNSNSMNELAPPIIYTAMHGVGSIYVRDLLEHFHLPPMQVVDVQINPDPTFPTVSFPNPEEKGALDIALRVADEKNVRYVMATDPDADRFICAEKTNQSWHVFKGDEIGAIFGYYMSSHSDAPKKCMVNSVVSSRLLLKIGSLFNVHCEQTLTGFKWMGNKQAELEEEGYEPMVTYEEAIGYAVGGAMRDKDGVSATAKMCEIIAELHGSGRTLYSLLQEIYSKCGYFTTRNSYVISNDKAYTNSIFAKLRNNGNYQFKFGSYRVSSIRDLTTGFDSKQEANGFKPVLPVDPTSHMITYEFVNEACLTLRTSGTEPKIKYYLEVTHPEKEECEKLADAMEKVIVREVFGKE